MGLVCITDASKQFGVSSKTLRYYENVGILKSLRMEKNKYRYYDEEALERIKQILILRKMQIPIKDIVRIYENEDMSTVVEVFVARVHAIDEQVGALSELKSIINEFLQTMLKNGITKISALPLLYEEMDKQLAVLEDRKPIAYGDLTAVSEKLAKPLDSSLLMLPPMRVLSSTLKTASQVSDFDGFSRYIQQNGMIPGNHERFEFQTDFGDIIIQRVSDDFDNNSEYQDYIFPGGLFAAANVWLDEDLGERFRLLVKSFDENKYYQIDYKNDGALRHAAMLENLISPDNQRELALLLVPVKKRMADPDLFEKPREITDITVTEIEKQNPILWTVDVPLDSITPIHNPHYRVTENGEAEYTGWISTRVLNTNVSVKLPFRVDIEFKIAGLDERFGYGDSEGSIVFYHGDDPGQFESGNFVKGYGVNTWNHADKMMRAIHFYQPIFNDFYRFPERGIVNIGEYNRLTWIVGEKHFAVIINDEIRYCGEKFPYMSLDLSRETVRPIVIGSNGQGMKYFRSIRVSQLTETPKNNLKKGDLIMITKQSNNSIPIIHRLVTSEHGENYWFNACARYVMESLGEYTKDADLMTKDIYNLKAADNTLGYWVFAALTGDIFTQHYAYDKYAGDAVSSYRMDEEMGGDPATFVEEIFAKCGYAATYVSNREMLKNTEMYLNTLISYIDKGIPVIAWGAAPTEIFGVFVGYEDYGKVLLYISGDSNQPERVSFEKALQGEAKNTGGWIFIGEKKTNRPIADIYREAIKTAPRYMTVKTDKYCFGPEAFRAWANDIENGKFDDMTKEEFDAWAYYTNYVCVLATNGSCAHNFIKRAQVHCPDMAFLEDINELYETMEKMWNNDNGEDLEALGGGFNVTLEILQDKEKRAKIAAKIRDFAKLSDEILRIFTENLDSGCR